MARSFGICLEAGGMMDKTEKERPIPAAVEIPRLEVPDLFGAR
jgi:hypothetical protein